MEPTLPDALATDLDAAFPRLVEAHQDRLYSIALRLLHNAADAEEAAQDAFVRAYRALTTWDRERIATAELRPWLAAIVVNVCRNRVRRRRPVTIPLGPTDGHAARAVGGDTGRGAADVATSDPADSPDESAVRRDAARHWAALVAGLPDRYRVPVVLRHVDGLSYDEMSVALGRPEGTLKAQVHRGLALLRAAALADAQLDREVLSA